MREMIREHTGIIFISLNLLLLVVVVFQYDPFGWSKRDYASSPSITGVKPLDMKSISLYRADDGTVIQLTRSEKQTSEKGTKDVEQEEWKNYGWSVTLDKDGAAQKYPADKVRLQSFIEALENSRTYYGVDASEKNREKYGMTLKSDDLCDCNRIEIVSTSGDAVTLFVGTTTGREGNSSLLRKGDDMVYLVRENLNHLGGFYDTDFFRSRRVVPEDLTVEKITQIQTRLKKRKNVIINRIGDELQLIEPVSGPIKPSVSRGILEEISNLTAENYVKGSEKPSQNLNITLEVTYRKTLTEPVTIRLAIIGKDSRGNYLIRLNSGEIVSVRSVYMDDLISPDENILDTNISGGEVLP